MKVTAIVIVQVHRLHRQHPELSERELSRMVPVSRQTVGRILSGKIPVPDWVPLPNVYRGRNVEQKRCPTCGTLPTKLPCGYCSQRGISQEIE